MVIVFEQDVRDHNGRRFSWRGSWFVGLWNGRRTWRLMWGLWSISYYPSPGLRDFFDHVESGASEWEER